MEEPEGDYFLIPHVWKGRTQVRLGRMKIYVFSTGPNQLVAKSAAMMHGKMEET